MVKSKKIIPYLNIVLIFILVILSIQLGSQLNDYNRFRTLKEAEENNKDYTIIITPETLQQLKDYFIETKEKEFEVCLIGEEKENIIFINGTDNFVVGNENSVNSQWCESPEYVGDLHKHPGKDYYLPSYQDVYTNFEQFKIYNLKVALIMYDECKFNVLSLRNWYPGNQEEKLCN